MLVRDRSGVEERFRDVYDRHYRRVLGYALRRAATPGAAEDVVAEVFLVAWRRIGDVPDGDEAIAWLLAVARRVLANTRRGDARRDRLVARLRQSVPPERFAAEVEDAVSARDEHGAVLAAVGRLRSDDAEVLQLLAWEQLSHAQAAVVLGCSVNAVAIRLHRARRRLADELVKGDEPAGHTMAEPMTPPAQNPMQP